MHTNKVIVIPVRYNSTRLPGKPLIKIHGKEMLLRTYEKCLQTSISKESIYVATDDINIREFCLEGGINVVMTSDKCLTGTDRIAEFSEIVKADYYINVQGDEPIIPVDDIEKVIQYQDEHFVLAGYALIEDESEYHSRSIPKMVFNESDELVYTSRSPIPGDKNSKFNKSYKQVCVYSFSRESLNFIKKNAKKGELESLEDLELLRFIEKKKNVKLIELSGRGISVDTQDDLIRINKLLTNS